MYLNRIELVLKVAPIYWLGAQAVYLQYRARACVCSTSIKINKPVSKNIILHEYTHIYIYIYRHVHVHVVLLQVYGPLWGFLVEYGAFCLEYPKMDTMI